LPSCMNHTLSAVDLSSFIIAKQNFSEPARYLDNDYCTKILFNQGVFEISAANLTCPAYTCAPSNNSACLYFSPSVNTNYLSPCAETSFASSYCPWDNSLQDKYLNVTCSAPPQFLGRLPGDRCFNSLDCLSGVCNKTTCIGQGLNQPCNDTEECDVGMRCKQTCVPLLRIGEQGCETDFDCNINAGCNLEGKTGSCTRLFSLDIGERVNCNSTIGFSNLCKSATCNQTDAGYCTYPPVSHKALPIQCTSDSDCYGVNNNSETVQSVCSCGFNPTGASYCSPLTGDPPGLEFVEMVRPT
jgi:hypothetical protein